MRDEREEKALLETSAAASGGAAGTRTGSVAGGPLRDEFLRFQGESTACVTNGAQAIECALKALGIGPGDEVLVPALTFVASGTAIALVGATPVFVDVDPETYNLSPDAMAAAITPRTRGIVVVHNGGYPADMDRIRATAQARGLRVVEDCAHAHGSQWRGEGVGHLGDFGTFSFQMGKTLTAGEGGCVITDDAKLAELAYTYHHIGRIPGRPFYEFHRLASNLRMTEWQGAILRTQLQRLPEQTRVREANATYLAAGLRGLAGVEPIRRDPRVTRWGFYYWNLHYRADALGYWDVFIKAARRRSLHGPAHTAAASTRTPSSRWDGGMPAHSVVHPVAEDLGEPGLPAASQCPSTTADMDLIPGGAASSVTTSTNCGVSSRRRERSLRRPPGLRPRRTALRRPASAAPRWGVLHIAHDVLLQRVG